MTQLLSNLNQEQLEAVQHPSGPAMVLAGAGSGKTTVLTTRVAWLLHNKQTQAHNVLVVTFTNKAAGEIKKRISNTTGFSLPFAGTFHSLCAKILRQRGSAIGLEPGFVIFDTDDQKLLLKRIYDEHKIDKERYSFQAVKNSISQAKNEILSPEQYAEFARGNYQTQVAQIYHWYQRELIKAQAVDFDDLLLRSLELLRMKPEIKNYYQSQFEHVLVDEYQDTNKVQYELTKLLSAPHNNLYVVGDFSQSIYAWRGADYRNMLLLKQDFANISEYRLEQNYRSDQNILDAASQVISYNTKHPVLKLWTTKPGGSPITIIEARDNREEADLIVRHIRESKNKYPYEDMAVLYRTNAQSRAFEEALVKAGIPYSLIGGTKFYERKEIKDVLAYLRYATNHADIISLERITKLGKRRLSNFSSWLEENKTAISEMHPAEIIKKILEITDYQKKYARKTEENISKLENIEELLNTASQFDSATNLLENVALIQDDVFSDAEDKNSAKRGIRLMSLHAAKGLEFSLVFMAGMEDGLLPHNRSLLDQDQMEEERRLCYVGITRAKQKLFCTYAKTRFQYGSSSNNIRSRFLQDIPSEIVEFISTAEIRNNGFSNNRRRLVPIDESLAEGVLSGDFDLDAFIDS